MTRKFSVLVLLVLSTAPSFAQSSDDSQVITFSEYVTKADDLLQVSVVFPLAGLAITAASFLFIDQRTMKINNT